MNSENYIISFSKFVSDFMICVEFKLRIISFLKKKDIGFIIALFSQN